MSNLYNNLCKLGGATEGVKMNSNGNGGTEGKREGGNRFDLQSIL